MKNLVIVALFFVSSGVHAESASESAQASCVSDAGQTLPLSSQSQNLLDVVKHLPGAVWNIASAPAGWNKEDWAKASAIVAAGVILSTKDRAIKEFSQSHRGPVDDKISNGFQAMGSLTYLGPALGLTYLGGVLSKNERFKQASLAVIEAAAASSVVDLTVKELAHRSRPSESSSPFVFGGPGLSASHLSFVSGHTTAAFSVATAFADAYGDHKIVPYLAYSAAALVGLSRIHDNAHWASDVLLGAALGHYSAKVVLKRFNPPEGGSAKKLGLLIEPGAESRLGVTLTGF